MQAIRIAAVAATLCLAPMNAGAWDLTSGIEVSQASGALNASASANLIVKNDGNWVAVSIMDSFYNEGAFEKPWLSLPTRRMATLHVGTKKSGGLFPTRDEFTRRVTLKVARSRIPKDTVLYVYNDDTGEVLGHALAR